SVGELVQRITGDVDALNSLLSTSVVMILIDSVTLVTVVVAMFLVNWRLALLALAILPFLAVITVFFRRRIRRTSDVERSLNSMVSGYLNEQIQGMLLVQLFRNEKRSMAGYQDLNARYRR